MSFFEFPHTRTYDSDLGWLIWAMKKLIGDMTEFTEINSIKFGDPINWNIATQYEPTTIVVDDEGNGYISRKAVPAGIALTDTNYWTRIFNFSDITDAIRTGIAVNNGDSATALQAMNKNDLIWWNGNMYQVLYDIAAGTALINGTNIKPFTVDEKINSVGGNIEQIVSDLNNEIVARENADTALQGAIAAEVTAREEAIENEATARENADANLQSQITAIENADINGFTKLIVNRLGTDIIKQSESIYSGAQGAARTSADTLAIYFADYYNQTDDGVLREFNVKTGAYGRSIQLTGAGHGQSVAYDNNNIYILYFTGASAAIPGTQYITIVRESDFANIGRFQAVFSGDNEFIVGLSFDIDDQKIKVVTEREESGLRRHFVRNAKFENNTFLVESEKIALDYAFEGENRVASYAFHGGSVYGLTNRPASIMQWNLKDGSYVKTYQMDEIFTDRFYMGESEAISIDENGDVLMVFNEITNRGTWTDQGSGWYMFSIGHANIEKNLCPWTPYNGIQWDAGFRNSFHVNPNTGTYANGGNTVNDPLKSIYIALLYKPLYGGFSVTMDADENVPDFIIMNRDNIGIKANNHLIIDNKTMIVHCNNISLYDIGNNKPLEIRQSGNVRIYGGSVVSALSPNESEVLMDFANGSVGTVNADFASILDTLGGVVDYDKFRFRIPRGCKISKTITSPTVTANGISTGVDRSKFDITEQFLWAYITCNNAYIRVAFTPNTGEMAVPWAYGTRTGVLTMSITSNIIYLKAISENGNANTNLQNVSQISIRN